MVLANRSPQARLYVATATVLLALVAFDATSMDLWLAQKMGGQHHFPAREHWLLTYVLHDGGRRVAWILVICLCVGTRWPVGPLHRLSMGARVQLASTTLAAFLAVAVLKRFSLTSCPWDLDAFGGWVRYASHWSVGSDGGPGHCFPAGHASAGFAFMGGYFAFKEASPRLARTWLLGAMLAGTVLGLAQQLRGAHFMSHTLWTAFACWCTGLAIDSARFSLAQREEARS